MSKTLLLRWYDSEECRAASAACDYAAAAYAASGLAWDSAVAAYHAARDRWMASHGEEDSDA
jgi:hypothetical protein